jgi:L-ascorbate metabolism protein UlaG (beta-lactamase superfamily)
MKITKLEHATLVLEQNAKKLVIDPGVYTRPLDGITNVEAIVITHTHDDHCNEAQLVRLLESSPAAKIYGTDEVRNRLENYPDHKFQVTAVHHGDLFKTGEFSLEFFGDMHIEIHRSIPLIQNCGVMINDRLYYPGDSYTQPDRKVEILACPTSAPWLKIGDVIDFITAVRPTKTFATHNIHLSSFGHELNNARVKSASEAVGGTFQYLEPGDSAEF